MGNESGDEVVWVDRIRKYKSARTREYDRNMSKAYRKIGIGKRDYRRRRRRERWWWWRRLFTYPFMNDITTPSQNKSIVSPIHTHAWHSFSSIWLDRLWVEFGDARLFRPKIDILWLHKCVRMYVVWFSSTIYRVLSKHGLNNATKTTQTYVHRTHRNCVCVCCKKQQQRKQKRIRYNDYMYSY